MTIIHINIPNVVTTVINVHNAVTTVDGNGDMYITTTLPPEQTVVSFLSDKELVERIKELKIGYVEFTCDDWTKCFNLTPHQLRSSMLEHLPVDTQAFPFVVASDDKNINDVHWIKTSTGWQEQKRIELPVSPLPKRETSDLLSLSETQLVEAIRQKGVKHVYAIDSYKEIVEYKFGDTLFNSMKFCRKVWISFIADRWLAIEMIRMWSRVENQWYQHEDAPDVEQAIKANFLPSK